MMSKSNNPNPKAPPSKSVGAKDGGHDRSVPVAHISVGPGTYTSSTSTSTSTSKNSPTTPTSNAIPPNPPTPPATSSSSSSFSPLAVAAEKIILRVSQNQSQNSKNISGQGAPYIIDSNQFALQVQNIFCELITSKYIGIDGTSDDLMDSAVYEHLVELFDKLLDELDYIRLDTGTLKRKLSDVMNLILTVDKERLLAASSHAEIEKPQLNWTRIDNARDTLFVPLLHDPSLSLKMNKSQEATSSGDLQSYLHPYLAELNALNYSTYTFSDLSLFKPWLPSSTQTFEYIDTEANLDNMISYLKSGCDEIAITLKNNSFRSFQGFICCMQISSRFRDYFIDTIKLRDCMHKLNVITTDSRIVKILHQAESQILWLQRDFGIYIVNAFDTYHAAKLLRYPSLSLAPLLKIFCAVTISKKSMYADWRVRPMSPEMVEDAKAESHHLLYIYDHIRKEVWDSYGREGLGLVFQATRKTCMQRYEKDDFWPLGYRKIISSHFLSRHYSSVMSSSASSLSSSSSSKSKAKSISLLQDAVLSKLYDWRDYAARKEDESVHYIMSNTELLYISTITNDDKQPPTREDVEACAFLSSYVRTHVDDIVALVVEAMHEFKTGRIHYTIGPWESLKELGTNHSHLRWVCETKGSGVLLKRNDSRNYTLVIENREDSEKAEVTKNKYPYVKDWLANRKMFEDHRSSITSNPNISSAALTTASQVSSAPLYGRALHTPSKELVQYTEPPYDMQLRFDDVRGSLESLGSLESPAASIGSLRPPLYLSSSGDQLVSDLYHSSRDMPEFSVVRSFDSSIKLMSVTDLFKQCGWEGDNEKAGSDDLEFRMAKKEFGPASLAPLNTKKLQDARPDMRSIAYVILTTFLGPNALTIVNNNSQSSSTETSTTLPNDKVASPRESTLMATTVSTTTATTSSSSSTTTLFSASSSSSSQEKLSLEERLRNFEKLKNFDSTRSVNPKDYTITESNVTEEDLFSSLPSSFADIYNLSNDIRKKNRDGKKKGGSGKENSNAGGGPPGANDNESDSSSTTKLPQQQQQQQQSAVSSGIASAQAKSRAILMEKVISSCDTGGILFDDNIYFEFMKLERDVTNLGVEGALSAAQESGWITDAAQRARLLEAYTSEQVHLQSESAGGDDASGSGYGDAPLMSSHKTSNFYSSGNTQVCIPTPVSPRGNNKPSGVVGDRKNFHANSQSIETGISPSSSSSSSMSSFTTLSDGASSFTTINRDRKTSSSNNNKNNNNPGYNSIDSNSSGGSSFGGNKGNFGGSSNSGYAAYNLGGNNNTPPNNNSGSLTNGASSRLPLPPPSNGASLSSLGSSSSRYVPPGPNTGNNPHQASKANRK